MVMVPSGLSTASALPDCLRYHKISQKAILWGSMVEGVSQPQAMNPIRLNQAKVISSFAPSLVMSLITFWCLRVLFSWGGTGA